MQLQFPPAPLGLVRLQQQQHLIISFRGPRDLLFLRLLLALYPAPPHVHPSVRPYVHPPGREPIDIWPNVRDGDQCAHVLLVAVITICCDETGNKLAKRAIELFSAIGMQFKRPHFPHWTH